MADDLHGAVEKETASHVAGYVLVLDVALEMMHLGAALLVAVADSSDDTLSDNNSDLDHS